MSKTCATDQLDALLRGLEDIALNAQPGEFAGQQDEVLVTASFIASRVAQRRSPSLRVVTDRHVGRPRRSIPRDAAGRRRLLGRLIATRPELPQRISLAFQCREPENDEIAAMLDELLRPEDGSGTE